MVIARRERLVIFVGRSYRHVMVAVLSAELEQFPVDAGRAPQRVCSPHPADQIMDL
jgi:hypothetical protein